MNGGRATSSHVVNQTMRNTKPREMGNVPRVGTQVRVSLYTRQTRETGADATREQSALVTSSKPVRKVCAKAKIKGRTGRTTGESMSDS